MSRRWPLTGVLLAVLWLFVRGVTLTPDRVAAEFLTGLLVGLPIAYAIRRFYPSEAAVERSLRVAPYAALYLLVFLRDLVMANLDVAWRVLAPSMPIDPAVVEVPLRVETPLAVTTIANSITLTPGTLTMDYDRETNTLYVHSIDGSDPDAIFDPIRTWEDYALVIFDEELKPGDPVPDRSRPAGDEAHPDPADGDSADAGGSDGVDAEPARETDGADAGPPREDDEVTHGD